MKRLDLSLGRRLVCLRIELSLPRILPCVIASLGCFTLMFKTSGLGYARSKLCSAVIVHLYTVLPRQYMSRPSRHPHGSYKHRTSYDYTFYYHTHIILTSLIPLPVTLLSLTPYFLPPVLRRLVYNYDLDKSQMVYSCRVCGYACKSSS
jgi:hypothetical protein